jgi:Zn-dependent protease
MINFIKSGRFFRVRLRVHYSWLLAVILITWAITTQFSTDSPFELRIASGIVAVAFFFIAILIREIVLVLIATNKGVSVERITLFPFGGLMETTPETTSPSYEFILVFAGTLGNLTIAGFFYLVYVFQPDTGSIVINVITKWLAFLYFTLTLFHFAPAYPLEGGRAFRAFLWKILDNRQRATQIASWVSWAFGVIIAIGGILLSAFTVERFTGIFLIAFGLALQNAATHSRRQLRALEPEDA